ncbi:tetratricopeptide repeat protein [Streptomyces sp. R35]|uniref:Tetratricopeptide repeat protein n=1 Tax=Streptomyces sp. R35 TaxID=3238630 RepID=A0AB39SAD2_9ACTN
MSGEIRPFSQDVWFKEGGFLDALLLVREVMRARAQGDAAQERRALRDVAAHAAFAGAGPAAEAVARGKWITERVLSAVGRLRDGLPALATEPEGESADKVVVLWERALSEGGSPGELVACFPRMFPVRDSGSRRYDRGKTAAAMRVRGTMWLRGNRELKRAWPGIERLYYEVMNAVRILVASQTPLAEPAFAYEWDRLSSRPSEERQLLTVLGFLAPRPLPLVLLVTGWEGLPSPLRRAVRDPAAVRQAVDDLAVRGLVVADVDGVTCAEAVQDAVRRTLDDRSARSAVAFTLRFLRAALPPDTHFHGSWALWQEGLAHLEAAIAHADVLGVRLEDAAYLLDRASVYRREAESDASTAIETSQRALALADRAGRPDPIEYAIYLGNQAMALRADRQFGQAVAVMGQSLEVTRASVGTDHEEYAGSLNILGSMLESWKRYEEAEAAHREALSIMRGLASRSSDSAVVQTLVEVLNDYAACLLREDNPARPPDADQRAADLLQEASALTRPGEHGWRQITANTGHALARAGRLQQAESRFREVVRYCEEHHGDPSYELYAALRDLADVLHERGDPEAAQVYLRAHEVDDAVGPHTPPP